MSEMQLKMYCVELKAGQRKLKSLGVERREVDMNARLSCLGRMMPIVASDGNSHCHVESPLGQSPWKGSCIVGRTKRLPVRHASKRHVQMAQ